MVEGSVRDLLTRRLWVEQLQVYELAGGAHKVASLGVVEGLDLVLLVQAYLDEPPARLEEPVHLPEEVLGGLGAVLVTHHGVNQALVDEVVKITVLELRGRVVREGKILGVGKLELSCPEMMGRSEATN